MAERGNAAKRLHSILLAASKAGHGEKVRKVWARPFGAQEDDLPQIYRHLGELHALVDDVEARINDLSEEDRPLYRCILSPIRSAISPINLSSQWNEYSQHLNGDVLARLQIMGHNLRGFDESEISDETLNELLGEINGVLEMVLTADIEEALRILLIDLLETMRDAVLKHKTRGAAGMREAVRYGLGCLLLATQEPGAAKTTLPKRIIALLSKYQAVVEASLKVAELPGKVAELAAKYGEWTARFS